MVLSLCPVDFTAEPKKCSVDNPIIHRDSQELRHDVGEFIERHGLRRVLDEDLLLRGARLAQDDVRFRAQGGLSGIEGEALQREETPRLKNQTRELNTILLTCCVAALVQVRWSAKAPID